MTRPASYKPAMAEQAKKLAALGATDREVAEFFEIAERTIHRWKHQYPELAEALAVGKAAADERVEQSLYRKATGYTFDAVKVMQYEGQAVIVPYVEHVPPDTTAAIFWLKNRRPEQWREKTVTEFESPVDLASVIARARKRVVEGGEPLRVLTAE